MATKKKATKKIVIKPKEKVEETKEVKVEAKVEHKEDNNQIVTGTVWDTPIFRKKVGVIERVEVLAPVPINEIYDRELRQYLINKWLGTNCYLKSKEWLEKRWVDMNMVERLKQYLSKYRK